MSWVDKIIAVHTAVTDQVSHGGRLKSERYFVWQEDGANDFVADGQHCASAITGMTDFLQSESLTRGWKRLRRP